MQGSKQGKLDSLDWRYLLARLGFLAAGTVGAWIMTYLVPDLEEVGAPLLVMVFTAVGEFLNRLAKDNTKRLSAVIFVCLAGLAASTASAQITVPGEVEVGQPIVATLETKTVPEGEVKVDTSWDIPADLSYREVGDELFIWAKPGKYMLSANSVWVQFEIIKVEVDGETRELKNFVDLGQEKHNAVFVVAGGEPDDDDDDDDGDDDGTDPDVPDDEFGNIGQRVAIWSRGLEGRDIAGNTYAEAARTLRSDPTVTIDDVSKQLVSRLKERVNYESADWKKVSSGIQADLQERWNVAPFSRGVLADYYDAIARGFKA